MKKTVIIVVGLLLCVVGATVIGQKKNLSPKEERREVREKRRADRIASFEAYLTGRKKLRQRSLPGKPSGIRTLPDKTPKACRQ